MMDPKKKRRLEEKGWKTGTVAEFLGMSPDEEAVMEIRLALRDLLRECCRENHITPDDLAGRLGTDKSCAKINPLDPTVSTDLLLRTLLLSGATLQRIGEIIANVTITQELKPEQEATVEAEPETKLAATG